MASSKQTGRGTIARPAAVEEVLKLLEERSTAKDRANLARFGITASSGKQLGRVHELAAAALWERVNCRLSGLS